MLLLGFPVVPPILLKVLGDFSKTCGQHHQAIAYDSFALRKSYPTFLFVQLSISKERIYSESINMAHGRKTLEFASRTKWGHCHSSSLT